MKKPQIIAIGFILLGLILFALSIFLITKEYFSQQPAVTASTPLPQPANTPTLTPTPSVKISTPMPTEEPTETPVPDIPSTVKQIAYNRWLVTLTSTSWFETDIPVIANDTVNMNTTGNEKVEHVQYKIGNKSYFTTDGRQHYLFEEYGFDAGFKDTLKLRLTGETAEQIILVVIDQNVGRCLAPDDEKHRGLHNAAIAWADRKKTK